MTGTLGCELNMLGVEDLFDSLKVSVGIVTPLAEYLMKCVWAFKFLTPLISDNSVQYKMAWGTRFPASLIPCQL